MGGDAMNKKDIKVGDKVTCKRPEPAYYSGYAGNPVCVFEPGMVGVVGSVMVPCVHTDNKFFTCVDFRVPGLYSGDNKRKNDKWRVSLYYDNIEVIV